MLKNLIKRNENTHVFFLEKRRGIANYCLYYLDGVFTYQGLKSTQSYIINGEHEEYRRKIGGKNTANKDTNRPLWGTFKHHQKGLSINMGLRSIDAM